MRLGGVRKTQEYSREWRGDRMPTRSRVNEGLQRERGARRSFQGGVRRSHQEEKAGYLLVQSSRRDY